MLSNTNVVASPLSKTPSDKVEDKLSSLVKLANEVLFETKSSSFFELFPDKITICMNRVTVSYNSPFVKDERPIPIEFINTAHVTKGIISSTLSIETFGVEKPNPIRNLKHDDARIARRYILALVECKKNGVDFRGYPIEEIKEKLLSIGRVRE